jgi:hypothetical protein
MAKAEQQYRDTIERLQVHLSLASSFSPFLLPRNPARSASVSKTNEKPEEETKQLQGLSAPL